MKKHIFTLSLLLSLHGAALAQLGLSYLHSDMLSTMGASYELNEKFTAELRIGMSVQDFIPHIQLNYTLMEQEGFNLYGGAAYSHRYGITTEISAANISVTVGGLKEGHFLTGLGFNVSPFSEMKNFAFVAEGLVGFGNLDSFLQGSMGLRYLLRPKD